MTTVSSISSAIEEHLLAAFKLLRDLGLLWPRVTVEFIHRGTKYELTIQTHEIAEVREPDASVQVNLHL